MVLNPSGNYCLPSGGGNCQNGRLAADSIYHPTGKALIIGFCTRDLKISIDTFICKVNLLL